MADTLMVVTMLAFIAVCIAYTKWCDRIIGPDEQQPASRAEHERAA